MDPLNEGGEKKGESAREQGRRAEVSEQSTRQGQQRRARARSQEGRSRVGVSSDVPLGGGKVMLGVREMEMRARKGRKEISEGG